MSNKYIDFNRTKEIVRRSMPKRRDTLLIGVGLSLIAICVCGNAYFEQDNEFDVAIGR